MFAAMEMLRARGHEVALFSMADDRGKATPYDHHFVNHVDFKSSRAGLVRRAAQGISAIYSLEARSKLRNMIVDFRPDVAHVRNIYHHLSPSILWELKAQAVPVLYHLNDFKMICPSYNMVSHSKPCEKCTGGKFWNVILEGCYQGPPGSDWMLAAEAYFHKWIRTYEKCVDRFLAPSQFVKEKLVETGWEANKINVLQHFQTIAPAKPGDCTEHAPIVYFGRLSPEKGLEDLIHAMQRLPDIPLIIAGSGPQRAELELLVQTLRLKNVSFMGHLDRRELDKLIAMSRFSVLPSRAYETMGKSILESFALGRTVVASDLGSRRELIQHGKTGMLFRPREIDHMAQIISELYHSPETAARMGHEAREFVRQNHTQESHYEQLLTIYEDLIRKRRVLRPLRVAFIGGRGVVSKYSGIETCYEETGKRLTELGHKVTVYCRSYFTPPNTSLSGMRIVRLPTIRTKHLETWVHTLLSTIHAAFSDCEIVHYHALGPALFSFLPRCAGKKTVVTIQGLDWQRKKWGWMASKFLSLGEQAAIRFPNSTIVVSKTLHQRYETQYHAQTSYVPNGTSLRVRNGQSHLKGWGLEPGRYILFLGRLSPEKNCHLLIQAYEELHPLMKLVLAGGSTYADCYASKLKDHASKQILFLDWLSGEQLNEIITHACIFVLPSDLEGLSLSLLDAMGAGVCVLASDIAENRELVDGAGYTFKKNNLLDLESKLQSLIADSSLRENAAIKAKERVLKNYLWPEITKQIEGIYLDVARRHRPLDERGTYNTPPRILAG